MKRTGPLLLAAALPLLASAAPPAVTLRWSQLKPAGEDQHNEVLLWAMEQLYRDDGPGKAMDAATQNARFQQLKSRLRYNAVNTYNGRRVRIAGFVVPLGGFGGGATSEFLIVPYFGACLHLPAPNRNQIIHATAAQPQRIGDIRQAFWIEGTLRAERFESQLASTAYRMTVHATAPYRGKANPYEGPLPHEDGR